MIKTVEQYLQSLNDGRQIWCLGEKVSDVRTHPTLSSIIKTASMDYVLPNHPDFRDLFVTKNEDGEETHFLLTSPKTPEDLLRRRNSILSVPAATRKPSRGEIVRPSATCSSRTTGGTRRLCRRCFGSTITTPFCELNLATGCKVLQQKFDAAGDDPERALLAWNWDGDQPDFARQVMSRRKNYAHFE